MRRSYDKDLDTFRHQYVVLACFVLGLILNEKFTVQEVFSYEFHIAFVFLGCRD